jgi:hypothetical protein
LPLSAKYDKDVVLQHFAETDALGNKLKLTPKEERFAYHYARTGDVAASAAAAGYKGPPAMAGGQVAKRPDVAARVAELQYEILDDISDLAVMAHRRILLESKSETAILKAVELAYKYGFARDQAAAGGTAKEIGEMSLDELDQAIQRTRALKASLQPSGDIIDVKPLDQVNLFA